MSLERIMARILVGVDEVCDGINAGALTPVAWHNEVAQLLQVGHAAAWMQGAGRETMGPVARRQVRDVLAEQVGYLNRFLDTVEADGWDDARMRARAAMYVEAIKQSYWRGATLGYPLPGYPGDGGTECLSRCKCRWELVPAGAGDDVDAYWRYGDAEHCAGCQDRAAAWAPYRIRGGEAA